MSFRCFDCNYKEHTEFGEDVIRNCSRCYAYVCFTCIDYNKELCGESICYECCERLFYKYTMNFVLKEYMEFVSKIRIICRLKFLKEELMMMTWKVERVEPWCGESWDIDD